MAALFASSGGEESDVENESGSEVAEDAGEGETPKALAQARQTQKGNPIRAINRGRLTQSLTLTCSSCRSFGAMPVWVQLLCTLLALRPAAVLAGLLC